VFAAIEVVVRSGGSLFIGSVSSDTTASYRAVGPVKESLV
jgi:hypothetical protein